EERLSIYHARKDETGAKSVATRRRILLDENPFAIVAFQKGVVLKPHCRSIPHDLHRFAEHIRIRVLDSNRDDDGIFGRYFCKGVQARDLIGSKILPLQLNHAYKRLTNRSRRKEADPICHTVVLPQTSIDTRISRIGRSLEG